MIKLNNENSVLTTFNTPFGRYKLKKTSFWLYKASMVCKTIANDKLVNGSSVEEHDRNFVSRLQRSQEHRIKLNSDKSVVKKAQFLWQSV